MSIYGWEKRFEWSILFKFTLKLCGFINEFHSREDFEDGLFSGYVRFGVYDMGGHKEGNKTKLWKQIKHYLLQYGDFGGIIVMLQTELYSYWIHLIKVD